MVRTVQKVDVPDGEPLAMVGEQMVGPLVAAQSTRGRSAANGRVKLEPLAIDCPWTLYGYVLCIDGKEQRPVAVIQCGIAAQRDCVNRVVLLSVGAAKQLSCGGHVQCHIAFEFNRTNEKCSRGNQNRASALLIAGVDC